MYYSSTGISLYIYTDVNFYIGGKSLFFNVIYVIILTSSVVLCVFLSLSAEWTDIRTEF